MGKSCVGEKLSHARSEFRVEALVRAVVENPVHPHWMCGQVALSFLIYKLGVLTVPAVLCETK